MTTKTSDPHVHYSLKHQAIAWVSNNLCGNLIYTVHHGRLSGMKRKGGLGWVPGIGPAPTAEDRFWDSLDLKGSTVYDVGAFEGLLALWFCRQAKQVICFEPTSRNRGRLQENLALNGVTNVTVRPYGLGEQAGSCEIAYSRLMPGGASVDPTLQSSIVGRGSDTSVETIEIRRLDDETGPPPDFVKIDVEGFESQVLAGGQRLLTVSKPSIFIEMHGETMDLKRANARKVLLQLEALGYSSVRHLESNSLVTGSNAEKAAEGHLFAQVL